MLQPTDGKTVNTVEQEHINIDGILLEICSTCICCPEQSINIWFLSDTVCQRSSFMTFVF
jgi:hypothetical protein